MSKQNLKTYSEKAPWAKILVLKKAEYKTLGSSDEIYLVKNCFNLTVVWKNRSDPVPESDPDPVWNENSGSGSESDQKGPDLTGSGSTTLQITINFILLFSGFPYLLESEFLAAPLDPESTKIWTCISETYRYISFFSLVDFKPKFSVLINTGTCYF